MSSRIYSFQEPSKQVKPTSFWASKGLALSYGALVEFAVAIGADKDPIAWTAFIQYALLLAPPIILLLARKSGEYGPVISRLGTVFLIVVVIDLFHLK